MNTIRALRGTGSLLLMGALFLWAGPVWAEQFQCNTPSKSGTVKISVFGSDEDSDNAKTGEISCVIPADSLTKESKARIIAKRISDSYAGVYTATSLNNDGKVTVTGVFGVTIKFGTNSTGETDLATCSFNDNAYCDCRAPASGVSWDGVSPASITFGTSGYTSTILTSPGQTPAALLGVVRADLVAHGVANVTLQSLAGGGARLRIVAAPGVTNFVFGSNDTGYDSRVIVSHTPLHPLPAASPVGLAALFVALAAWGGAALGLWRRGVTAS